mgnify:CR=1 FL=1
MRWRDSTKFLRANPHRCPPEGSNRNEKILPGFGGKNFFGATPVYDDALMADNGTPMDDEVASMEHDAVSMDDEVVPMEDDGAAMADEVVSMEDEDALMDDDGISMAGDVALMARNDASMADESA